MPDATLAPAGRPADAGLEEVACECYGIIRRQYEERLARVREPDGCED